MTTTSSSLSPNNEREMPRIVYSDDSLTFANQNISCIPSVLWQLYPKTRRLDLSYNVINTFQSVEKFHLLTELILDNNLISERGAIPIMPSLKLLSINNNRINDLQEFVRKIRECFPNLVFLSMLRNKACPNSMFQPTYDDNDYQCYRYFVVHYLPKLKYLDSTPVSREEFTEAKKRGHLMYIRTPRDLAEENDFDTSEEALVLDNIPVSSFYRHRGEYLRTELCFTNKESEGNRFILNEDL